MCVRCVRGVIFNASEVLEAEIVRIYVGVKGREGRGIY